MSSVWTEPRGDAYSLVFRWQGKKYRTSLGKLSTDQAERFKIKAEDTLADMARGRLIVPDKVDLALFVLSDGRAGIATEPAAEPIKLHAMLDAMLADTPKSSWAETSWDTLELHIRNLKRCIPNVPITEIVSEGGRSPILQKYIRTRSKEDTNPEGPRSSANMNTMLGLSAARETAPQRPNSRIARAGTLPGFMISLVCLRRRTFQVRGRSLTLRLPLQRGRIGGRFAV